MLVVDLGDIGVLTRLLPSPPTLTVIGRCRRYGRLSGSLRPPSVDILPLCL